MVKDRSRIWLSPPHMHGEEQKYIGQAFEENWVSPYGSNITAFEESLEKYLGDGSYVTLLSSGTAAIHLGLILLGVDKGDEVIVQSHTHIASVNPVVYLGATPIFVDSEANTWNMCPQVLEEAIKDRIRKAKKPKAIIAAHLYGMPYKVKEINEIAQKYGIPILEDSAESLGSSYEGKKCGVLADIGIFSFNGNKIITTSGGGALVTKRKDWNEKAAYLAAQAKENKPYYEHKDIGYNYRLSNICAGIGRGQMEHLDLHIQLRRDTNAFYQSVFNEIEGVDVLREPEDCFFSNYWLSTVIMDVSKNGGVTPEDLRLYLEENNIESRPIWKPMHLQPVFKGCAYYGGNVSETIFNNGLCLPSGSSLTHSEKDKISGVLNTIFKV